MNKKVIILDIETTSLKPIINGIVEIGVVLLDLETGVIKVLYNHVIKPKTNADSYKDAWVFNNTSLGIEEVLNGVSIEHPLKVLQPYFNKYPVTAFNNKFDFSFMQMNGFKFPNKADDPMLLAMKEVNERFKDGGLKWPSAQRAFDHFFPNTGYKESHRGLDDAWHEAMIVKVLYNLKLFKLNK